METFIFALLLAVVGLVSAIAGYVLFRIMLPVIAFVMGSAAGFSGIQAIFGTNVWSFFAAILTAFILGLLFAALSYFYYTLAVVVIAASFAAGALAYLGQAIGLNENGFVVFLLSLSGAIVGGLIVIRYGLQRELILWLTSILGLGALLASAFLLFGDLELIDLHENGVLGSITDTVTSSWLWLFVLLGGSVVATGIQRALVLETVVGENYIISDSDSKAK